MFGDWGYLEHAAILPVPVPHLCFATVWRLAARPEQIDMTQINPSYDPEHIQRIIISQFYQYGVFTYMCLCIHTYVSVCKSECRHKLKL